MATLYAADAGGKGGKPISDLADMAEAGTLDTHLAAQGHAKGPHRTLVKKLVRQERSRRSKQAEVQASTIPPASLLQHFHGSTEPLVVEYGGASRRKAEFRVIPPLHTETGEKNTWFDHEKFLGDLFNTRSDVQVTGVVHPSTKIAGEHLQRFEGAIALPDHRGPSSPLVLPAHLTQPSAVTVRATRAPTQQGMRQLDVAKTTDFDPTPPYVQTLLGSGMKSEAAEKRSARRTTPESPDFDLNQLPGTLSLVAKLGKVGMLDVEATRGLLRSHGAQLAKARDATAPGGYLERMADIDTSLVQKIRDYHHALHKSRLSEQAAQARSDTAPKSWAAHTLRRPRTTDPAAEDIDTLMTGGFTVETRERAPELFTGTAQISNSRPVTDYSRTFDPAVHRAEHVHAWAKAVLTGETDDLDRTSVKVGELPQLAEEDIGKVKGRGRKASVLGEKAAVQHATHVDMSKDMTDGVEGGQNFLYRLAQQHGVDPDEGHAEKIMANAQTAAENAPKTAGQRLIGMPARGNRGRGTSLLTRRSLEPVTSSRWLSMAKERIAGRLLGEKTIPLPPLHPGMPEPEAPKAMEPPEPSAPPEAHAAFAEGEKTRLALQGEIDTWKTDLAEREHEHRVESGLAPATSQTEAAPYIRQIAYNPPREGPTTPAPEEDQGSFVQGFRKHRSALIEAYRRSDAADSLFPGGRGNRLAEVALGTAVQQTRLRGENNAAHNLGGTA